MLDYLLTRNSHYSSAAKFAKDCMGHKELNRNLSTPSTMRPVGDWLTPGRLAFGADFGEREDRCARSRSSLPCPRPEGGQDQHVFQFAEIFGILGAGQDSIILNAAVCVHISFDY